MLLIVMFYSNLFKLGIGNRWSDTHSVNCPSVIIENINTQTAICHTQTPPSI